MTPLEERIALRAQVAEHAPDDLGVHVAGHPVAMREAGIHLGDRRTRRLDDAVEADELGDEEFHEALQRKAPHLRVGRETSIPG